jgi:hypothetical protein
MGFKNKRKMKYLKLFEKEIHNILKDEVKDAIKPMMDDAFTQYDSIWEVIDGDLEERNFYFLILIHNPKNKVLNKIDEFGFFSEEISINVNWEAVNDFIRDMAKEIPNLTETFSSFISFVEDDGIYHIELEVNKDFLRSSKAGLWNLKTKEK